MTTKLALRHTNYVKLFLKIELIFLFIASSSLIYFPTALSPIVESQQEKLEDTQKEKISLPSGRLYYISPRSKTQDSAKERKIFSLESTEKKEIFSGMVGLNPLVSPDGQKILSNNRAPMVLHNLEINRSQEINFDLRQGISNLFMYPFMWSPDSKFLVATDKTEKSLHLINTETFNSLKIADISDLELSFSGLEITTFSPNGEMIAFIANGKAGTNTSDVIFLTDTKGKEYKQISRPIGNKLTTIDKYFWSKDGKSILYFKKEVGSTDKRIVKVDLLTNESVELDCQTYYESKDSCELNTVGWDGDNVYSLLVDSNYNESGQRQRSLYKISLETSKKVLVKEIPIKSGSAAMHGFITLDGEWFVYKQDGDTLIFNLESKKEYRILTKTQGNVIFWFTN